MTELLYLLQDQPGFFYGLVAFIGLFVGSFLNVVIHRLPLMMEAAWREGLRELDAEREAALATGATPGTDTPEPVLTAPAAPSDDRPIGMADSGQIMHSDGMSATGADEPFNLAVPRSRCPHCGAAITWWQNIPVLSYLLLRARCYRCHTRIPARYPLVELATMVLSLIVAWQLGPGPQALLGLVVTWYLVALSMIDFDHQLLPDSLTLPLLWIGLLASLLPVFAEVREAVIGAALGYGILWAVYWLFRLLTGKEGMGYGDFKLLAAIGALLGWQALPMVILLSSLVGALVGLSLIAVTGRDRNIPIPFGPYLAAAGWIAMLWGESLGKLYTGLLL